MSEVHRQLGGDQTPDGARPGPVLSYCTNVHPGGSLEAVCAHLSSHAAAVRTHCAPDGVLPVSLWLSNAAVTEAFSDPARLGDLRRTLDRNGLVVRSLNAFPFDDFHTPVVKRAVYRPDWRSRDRLEYTLRCTALLAQLSPGTGDGAVSTLPLGWRTEVRTEDDFRRCADHLLEAARSLRTLEETTGRCVHIDLEPEPGCALTTSSDVVRFFESILRPAANDDALVERYLRVCHDVCHAAVMFENQEAVLSRYRGARIRIGKVQISSAVAVEFTGADNAAASDALEELGALAEPRYLHQTCVRLPGGGPLLYDDLTDALEARGMDPQGAWRTHFHLPIFLERLGALGTTQSAIIDLLRSILPSDLVSHYEVETYAWSVLPAPFRRGDLASGIAREIDWLRDALAKYGPREGA